MRGKNGEKKGGKEKGKKRVMRVRIRVFALVWVEEEINFAEAYNITSERERERERERWSFRHK